MVCMTYFCPTSSQRFGRETVQHRYTLGKTHNRFCYGKRFSARLGGGGGGVAQERFSDFGNNRFFKQGNCRKNRNITGKKNIIIR